MNKIVKFFVCFLMILFFNISVAPVNAAIFKCINTDGKIYYKDKPCPLDNKETELKAIKDPINGYIPPSFSPEENIDSKSGTVIGLGSDVANNTRDDSDENDKVSIREESGSQSGEQISDDGGQAKSSEKDIASARTESDKAFNSKLNAQSKSSNKGLNKNKKSLNNISILEPSG